MEDVATGSEVAGEVLYLAGDTPAVLSRVHGGEFGDARVPRGTGAPALAPRGGG